MRDIERETLSGHSRPHEPVLILRMVKWPVVHHCRLTELPVSCACASVRGKTKSSHTELNERMESSCYEEREIELCSFFFLKKVKTGGVSLLFAKALKIEHILLLDN